MMAGAGGNGQLTVPPGFRFHPTDEELLYYYLRKKVSYEAIDLDVIREIDLNKLEPWDLKDKCRIGSGPQNEWYFFSHKDKKYPTGTRTNRATIAGFWKATGRDKEIHLINSKRIGMRKTLVFYTGRAPHGHKTDWIMHEYRLDDDHHSQAQLHQEDGWVVCRVFKKKNQTRCFQVLDHMDHEQDQDHHHRQQDDDHMINKINSSSTDHHHYDHHHHHLQPSCLYETTSNATANYNNSAVATSFDAAMHLPQLFSPESAVAAPPPPPPSFISPGLSLSSMDLECSQSLLRLTSGAATSLMQHQQQQTDHQRTTRFHGGDWSFLDKLLASHGRTSAIDHHQISNNKFNPSSLFLHVGHDHHVAGGAAVGHHHHPHKFPFGQYLGCEPDLLKFSK